MDEIFPVISRDDLECESQRPVVVAACEALSLLSEKLERDDVDREYELGAADVTMRLLAKLYHQGDLDLASTKCVKGFLSPAIMADTGCWQVHNAAMEMGII